MSNSLTDKLPAMKKTILIFSSLFLLFTFSYAQVNIGVKAGLNVANVSGIEVDKSARLGIHGGLLAEVGISKKVFFRPEALFSVKGYRYYSTDLDDKDTISYNYISVPLIIGFRPAENLAILLGPEFNFMTSAKIKFDESNDISNLFKKFDIAADLGIAYYFTRNFGAELRYSHSFGYLMELIYTDPLGNDLGTEKTGHNRVFQVGLFYRFTAKK